MLKIKKIIKNKSLLIAGTIILVVLFLTNIGVTAFLLVQNHKNSTTLNEQYIPRISFLIDRALSTVNKPTVIDPLTNKVYLPEAKLVLPPTPGNLDAVVYGYYPPSQGIPKEVQVANEGDIIAAKGSVINGESIKAIFKAVPKAQACVRGISIYFQQQSGEQVKFSKKLTNGQTVYFYTEPMCPDSNFLKYVEQINSY